MFISDQNFDFRDCISEERDVQTFAKTDKFAWYLLVENPDPEFGTSLKYGKQCQPLIGEFHDKTLFGINQLSS